MLTTVEFTSVAENGVIRIPEQFRNETFGEIRVIILPAASSIPRQTAAAIQQYLDEHADVQPFDDINDAVEWQKKRREEWERNVH